MNRITKKEYPNWKRTSRPQGAEVANASARIPGELAAKWRSIPRKGQWVDSLLRSLDAETAGKKKKSLGTVAVGFQIDAALAEKWRAIPDKGEWLAERIRNYEPNKEKKKPKQMIENYIDSYKLEKSVSVEGGYVLTDTENLCVITFVAGDYENTKKVMFVGEEPENAGRRGFIVDEAEKYLALRHPDIAFSGERFCFKVDAADNRLVYCHNGAPRWETRLTLDCIHHPDEFIESIGAFKEWVEERERKRTGENSAKSK